MRLRTGQEYDGLTQALETTGTLVTMKIRLALASTAVILVAAASVYFTVRTPRTEPLRMPTVEPLAADEPRSADVDPVGVAAEGPVRSAAGRSAVAEEPPVSESAARGSKMLRVILGGISEEDVGLARVTVAGVEEGELWPPTKVQDQWPCQGLTSEFDLGPFFARVEQRIGNLRGEALEVEVDHPQHFSETIRVSLSSGVELENGQTVYEVRMQMAEVVFWPELTLVVRDATTRAHLDGVELRFVPTAFMGLGQQPWPGDPFTLLGRGLSSPIALMGGRKADQDEGRVAGLALSPAPGEAHQPAELTQPEETERGVVVYARAPGYAWGAIVLDVSMGSKRELLLGPAATLNLRLENVQLDSYAALEQLAMLNVVQPDPRGGTRRVWSQQVDETLGTEGLRLDGLELGEHVVSVELGGSWREAPVLASAELFLAAGETRELVLTLDDPPAPPERAPFGGVVSFPTFGREQDVRLQFYRADYRRGEADFELSMADLEPVGGALPTWSFHVEDLPVGLYQIELMPFQKAWVIEHPAGGRDDVELVVPELAEVRVETVDARTGERIPLEAIRYGYQEELPGRVHNAWNTAGRIMVDFDGEPGRFRFWTAPGAAYVQTWGIPSDLNIGSRRKDLELVPGFQTVKFELAPACTLRFEFRVDGAALPHDDGIFTGLSQGIRAVDHEGRVAPETYWLFQASAPGLYEISFEGIGADRFLPIPPRRVDVSAGETTEVIVDLYRK